MSPATLWLKMNSVKDWPEVLFLSSEDKLLGVSRLLDLLLIPNMVLSWIRLCSDICSFWLLLLPFFWFSLQCSNPVESTGVVSKVSPLEPQLLRLLCTAASRILPFFIVSSLKRDALSAELMMTLRSEMLSWGDVRLAKCLFRLH